MEKHKCKLCFKNFANGKALGGHMKAHVTSFPLPPKPSPSSSSSSDSASFSSSDEEDQELEEKSLIYELRENPKKSFNLSDHVSPSNPDSGGSTSIVQDRESETESKNPTPRRSKRNHWKKPNLTNPPADPEPASSVSYTSPDEDVAIWLMMLSRDKWSGKKERKEEAMKGFDFEELNESMKLKKSKGKNRCKRCMKEFRSYRALWSHKNICLRDKEEIRKNGRIFECPFCFKVFGSGQALGGHKRSHLVGGRGSSPTNAVKSGGISLIDLNLPAPMEEDEDYSVVSDL